MATQLTAPVAAPLDRLCRLAAASATFQRITRSVDASEALRHAFIAAADDDEESQLPPRVVVGQSGMPVQMDLFGVGTTNEFKINGDSTALFEFWVPRNLEKVASDSVIAAEFSWYWETVGQIIAEMAALSGRGESVEGESHLYVDTIALRSGPWFEASEESDQNRRLWWSEWSFTWRR